MNRRGAAWLAFVILAIIVSVFILLAMRGTTLPIVDYFKDVTGLTKDSTEDARGLSSKGFLWNKNSLGTEDSGTTQQESNDKTNENSDSEDINIDYSFNTGNEEEFYTSFNSFLEQISCDLNLRDQEREKVQNKVSELNKEWEESNPEDSRYFRLYEYETETECFSIGLIRRR